MRVNNLDTIRQIVSVLPPAVTKRSGKERVFLVSLIRAKSSFSDPMHDSPDSRAHSNGALLLLFMYVHHCPCIHNNRVNDHALYKRLDGSVGGPIAAATYGWRLCTNETYTQANRSKPTVGGARITITPGTATTHEFDRCADKKWRQCRNV